MKLVLAVEALADLEQIGRWAGQEFPERGHALIDLLEEHCEGLIDYPRRFPVIGSSDSREIRKLVVRRHLIFYALIGQELRVLRIVHGATNWALLFALDCDDVDRSTE